MPKIKQTFNGLLFFFLSFTALSVHSQESSRVEISPYKTSAEFGALFKTGDTKSGDIKTGLDFDYEKAQWRSTLSFDLLIRKKDKTNNLGEDTFETTDQKWTVVSQTNYTLDESKKNYIYGNVSYEDNRFSSFDSQSSISLGWGRRWFENKVASLDADIGPGYKRDVLKAPSSTENETKDSLIVQAQALYKRKINSHVQFKQLLVARYAIKSGENSTFKAETSITTKLIETLQLKFSFQIDYNSDVDENKENTNTQTAMTLVYSF